MRLFLIIGLLCVGALASGRAGAQPLPGSADPGRFDKRFELPARDAPDIQQSDTYDVETTIPEVKDGFVLHGVHLSGVNAFAENTFQPIIDEYVGRSVDLATLRHLADRITAYYRERGYFLTRTIVPEQTSDDGHITIEVLEGYVYDVIISDEHGLLDKDAFNITAAVAEKIKALNPLHGPTLERYVLLLNEGAGATVQTLISSAPKATAPGGVIVTLLVQPAPSVFFLGYNNHGSRFVGPHQAELAWQYGGILSPYDILTVQSAASIPLRELQYGSLQYETPISSNGLKVLTSLSYGHSKPGHTLEVLDVESRSLSVESGFSYPAIRSRRHNLDIGFIFSLNNSSTEFLDEELIDDKIRAFVLSADYNRHGEDGGVNMASISLFKGLNILGATKTGTLNLSRTQGRSDFFKVEATFARLQPLPMKLELLGRVSGQYAPHPLLSSAEFGYGGPDFGRAYDPSEITGDQGLAAALELRYNGIDTIGDVLSLTPFIFYDIGKVWNEDSGAIPVSAASAGFGSYYQFDSHINGAIIVAWPLTKSVTTPIMGGSDGPRFLFQMNSQF